VNSDTYRKLEAIFSEFNEAIIIFYDKLCTLYPPHKREDLLTALGMTLKNVGEVYRYVSTKLFEAQK
jgi:hypothetical protein